MLYDPWFSADFRFTKQKRYQGDIHANSAFNTTKEAEQEGSNVTGAQKLTKENVTELLQLLQQSEIGPSWI